MGDLTQDELALLADAGKTAKQRYEDAGLLRPPVDRLATVLPTVNFSPTDIQMPPEPTAEELAEQQTKRERWRAQEREHKAVSRTIEASIPKRYRWAIDHNDVAGALKLPKAKLEAFLQASGNVTLGGGTGAGKTSLGSLLLHNRAYNGERAFFVSAYELERERRITPLGEGDGPLLSKAMSAQLILLDDIGAEQNSTFSPLVDLVFYRYDRELSTIATTGLGRGELVQRYGAGFVRRLFEGAFVWELGGRA